MAEIYACPCGFKTDIAGLDKTDGKCPKCGTGNKRYMNSHRPKGAI